MTSRCVWRHNCAGVTSDILPVTDMVFVTEPQWQGCDAWPCHAVSQDARWYMLPRAGVAGDAARDTDPIVEWPLAVDGAAGSRSSSVAVDP